MKNFRLNFNAVRNTNTLEVYENEKLIKTWYEKEQEFKKNRYTGKTTHIDLESKMRELELQGYKREYTDIEKALKGLNTEELISVCNGIVKEKSN